MIATSTESPLVPATVRQSTPPAARMTLLDTAWVTLGCVPYAHLFSSHKSAARCSGLMRSTIILYVRRHGSNVLLANVTSGRGLSEGNHDTMAKFAPFNQCERVASVHSGAS